MNDIKSIEEFELLDFEYKKLECWSLIVSINFAHSFDSIEKEVFFETEDLPEFTELEENTISVVYLSIINIFNEKQIELDKLSRIFWIDLGRKIYRCKKELDFGGFTEMNYAKLMGYLLEKGSCNEMNSVNVSNMISKIEKLIPRVSKYKSHVWTTSGDYITLRFSYVALNEKDSIMSFFETWEKMAKKIKVDSVRYELNELSEVTKSCSIEFIFWWD